MNCIYLILLLVPIIACTTVLDLSGKWSLYNSDKKIQKQASVPGGVYTDLVDITGDILFGDADTSLRWIARDNWTYHTSFTVGNEHLKYRSIWLVLNGVDTIAEVYVNNYHVLSCNNMFIRYTANIKHLLQVPTNTITVGFSSPVLEAAKLSYEADYPVPPLCPPPSYNGECHMNMLRKMQASFSWDWGPSFPSVGIWKKPEIVLANGPLIEAVVVKTVLSNNFWEVSLTVYFGPSLFQFDNLLTAEFFWSNHNISKFSAQTFITVANSQKHEISFKLPKDEIKVWWPNGYGDQNLYLIRVSFMDSIHTLNIGFRTISLIQSAVDGKNNGNMFYFEVNGQKIFAKGSNWIPSSIKPEDLSNKERVTSLLEAAAATHANMIRVWGGGVYESDMFYQTCDRLGIMVWQDMMFACSMYPGSDTFLENVKVEIEQQIKRLQHHPSIAIWAGNNENEGALADNWYGTSSNFSLYQEDYLKLYVDTIKPIVTSIDDTRTYLISSPSNDIAYFTSDPGNPLYGDVHYYNYVDDGWDYQTYPSPRFASEYGSQSFPSFECLQTALPSNQISLNSPLVDHRQHSPNGTLNMINQISKNLPMSKDLKDIVYLSQINQAMAMKTESEKYRRLKSTVSKSGEGYTMGALYWQLNDVWQAPTWSSIDYCGNWKMLHYYAIDFFAPIIVSPEMSPDGQYISLYVVIDGISPNKAANLIFNVYKWSSNAWCPDHSVKKTIQLEDNNSVDTLKIPINDHCKDKNCFYTAAIEVDEQMITPENFVFHLPLKDANYPETVVEVIKVNIIDKNSAKITLLAQKYALFVWLNVNGVQGRFSKNGFHMSAPIVEVNFNTKEDISKLTADQVTVNWLKRNYSQTH